MHGKRSGTKKANNRDRPRKLKSVILTPNSCGGRAPVLEAGEHRAVRHNTRRRSLNHYDSTEPSGRLIGHNRFPTLPSPLFPSGFKERFVVLCCIFFPFVGLCPPSLSPGGPPLGAQPIFSSVGGILPSSCISPNLYCLLLEIFCLLGICCLPFFCVCFLWQQNRSKRRRGVCGDNNSCRRGNSFAAMSLQTQTTTLCLGCSSCPVTVHRSSLLHVLPSTCPGIGKGAPKVERS